ncbi:hypothetical protein [Streptomyces sp. NRRL F-5727]|uniref:hypothetical protein n=1 Tax=Streptomyces sp. NRRL F-5727 TaxID=1463871 RepID=UPI0004CB29E2|nr:hypothetical protein [Streptomyces sp. NRRL F-5727]
MTAFRQYFEDNPDVFAALVAAVAILGGLLGSVIGARIQANGGRDQAAAAREAARIAAEAQRVAALWNVRQAQIAEFVRSARELTAVCEGMYRSDDDAESRRARVDAASREMVLREAEIRLVAPAKVADAASEVTRATKKACLGAMRWGPLAGGRVALKRLCNSEDDAVRHEARAAMRVLDDESSSRTARRQALSAVEGLSGEHVRRLSEPPTKPTQRIVEGMRAHQREVDSKMTKLFNAAREMLRSEDDVAPAAPEQRRR